MKGNVTLLIYHGRGHFNACFKIANILIQNKYKVTFCGHSYFKKYIEEQGFSFYPLNSVPFGLSFERWVNISEKRRNIFWNILKDRWTNRLFRIRQHELTQAIEKLNPDFLLIDSWQSTDFVALYPVLKKKKIRIGFLQTMLSTTISRTSVPLNSLAIPVNEKDFRREFLKYRVRKIIITSFDSLKFLGMDNATLLSRSIAEVRLPEKYRPEGDSLFSRNFQSVSEFILAPHSFEFTVNSETNQYYIGFKCDTNRKESTSEVFELLKNTLQHSDKKIIYCSFGTVAQDDISAIKKAIQRLIKVCTSREYVLVVSCNNRDVMENKNINPDAHFFNDMPQLSMLKICHVFVTHGGLNSVKESIYSEVPMLVLPVDKKVDHNGNSARVVFHGLGLRGNLEGDTETEIDEKIDRLLTDSSFILNLKKIKETDKQYSDHNFVNLFEKLNLIE
jgi:zeaxanthin glucosyltransferase